MGFSDIQGAFPKGAKLFFYLIVYFFGKVIGWPYWAV